MSALLGYALLLCHISLGFVCANYHKFLHLSTANIGGFLFLLSTQKDIDLENKILYIMSKDDRRHSVDVADIYNPKWCRTYWPEDGGHR